jgi:PAS domain S-box-containing protein
VVTNDVFFSPRWKSMLGYADAEIKNVFASWEKLLHPDDHERAMATLCGYLSGRQRDYALEHRLRHKDGSYRWILARGAVLRDAEGRPVRMAGSHVDITERKQTEEKLRGLAESLAQSNRDLEDFATVASHDLQEPIGKLQAFAELLEAEAAAQLSDKARDYLRRIHKASRRAQVLLHGLLSYSLVQTAARPFVPVDLTEVARDVLADLDSRIQQAGARVTTEPLGQIEGDPVQLHQLLLNLVGNALKFARPGVPLVIRMHAPRAREGEPDSSGRREVCHLTVEDNGIGIEPRHRDRLFMMFQRIHPQQYEGTGVGLAICRRIAQRHGGCITVQSQPGLGSSFIVTLPVRQPFQAPPPPASPPGVPT